MQARPGSGFGIDEAAKTANFENSKDRATRCICNKIRIN
jgi:hypothetical protein